VVVFTGIVAAISSVINYFFKNGKLQTIENKNISDIKIIERMKMKIKCFFNNNPLFINLK
jgi:hypothetical protein